MANVVFNVGQAIEGFEKLQDNLGDMTQFFRNVAELELEDTKLRFDAELDPKDNPWPDPFTIRRGIDGQTGSGARTKTSAWSKDEAWGYVIASNFHATPPGWRFFSPENGDKILRDNGTLFSSIKADWGPDFAIVGTNLEYAEKLQMGRFPFIGLTSRTEDNIIEAFNTFMAGTL